jgi:hypothetical protein
MNDYELRLALLEYDSALTNVRQIEYLGFEIQIEGYKSDCKKIKYKATDKANVMFQTDFIERTYRDFLYNERDLDSTIAKLGEWYHGLIISNIETIDWNSVIYNTNANNLEEVIKLHYDNISDEIYWKIIGHCYTNSELGHSNSEVIAGYLNNPRPERHYLMNVEERAFLAEVPEQLTIYRGCSIAEIESNKLRYSWTLDIKVAEFFAYKYTRAIDEKNKCNDMSKYDVIERVINKDEIVAYFNGRDESEILYFPKN